MRLLTHCLLVLAVTSSCAAADCGPIATFADGRSPLRQIFVSPAGNDESADGSRTEPFRTIARAARNLRPGDAVRLLPGTHQPGTFLNDLAGTAEHPIWIGGVPGMAKPVIAGGSQALHLSRVRYLVIEHIEIAGATGNGINCDDGADYANVDATRFLVFRDLHFHDIGKGGNQDALKLSGVDDYQVLDCRFERTSAGGSAIDHVGCHRGLLAGNTFSDIGSNAIQCKGGSRDLQITRNRFLNGGQRAINIGGSTGFQFFRPPLSRTESNVEAADIRVTANLFIGSMAPVAFVGATNCVVANNTIVDPERWVIRILQETSSKPPFEFAACGGNAFRNNLVHFSRGKLAAFVNDGSGTDPGSFAFANNLWYAHDRPERSAPSLPVAEVNAVIGRKPGFVNAEAGDYRLSPGSAAIAAGAPGESPFADFDGRCFGNPPSIGAWEYSEPRLPSSDGR